MRIFRALPMMAVLGKSAFGAEKLFLSVIVLSIMLCNCKCWHGVGKCSAT